MVQIVAANAIVGSSKLILDVLKNAVDCHRLKIDKHSEFVIHCVSPQGGHRHASTVGRVASQSG
jgi:hypothetical protein